MKKIVKNLYYLIPTNYRVYISKIRFFFRLYFFYFLSNKKKYKELIYWQKKKLKYGNENPDKNFYILRKYPKAMGLLSCYLTFLGQLQLMKSGNYYPIVDMKSVYYPGAHNSPEEGGHVNAWEYYFNQVSEFSIDSIKNSKNIFLTYGNTSSNAYLFFDNSKLSKNDITKWAKISNHYIRLKPELISKFEDFYKSNLMGNRVLGVMFREEYVLLSNARDNKETLYSNHPGIQGHPIQPNFDVLLGDIKRKMEEWKCSFIFVCSETTFFLDFLIANFGEKVIFTKRPRKELSIFNYTNYVKSSKEFFEKISIKDNNIFYLEEVYLLSKCTSMLSSKCSGSVVASIWNNNEYENMEFYTLGLY